MKALKKILKIFPELFLILSTLFYWISAGLAINYIAIVLITIVVLQLIYKKQGTGIALGVIFSLIFCYMFLALLSDVVKLESISSKKWQTILAFVLYFGSGLVAGIVMTIKYISQNRNNKELSF
ncbi:hypothetical protein [Patiriisocius hiemis]|uniref:Permease n=1 Tax=Patiriisocius hiemis TaxID=3075604 RepID=A0ABU2Y8X7_9FLAO|nr:hypothetical protein [Constantimarinum sp. W242]MDT0554632.1 hypothetical protein [Constantimarinum sp. W242]